MQGQGVASVAILFRNRDQNVVGGDGPCGNSCSAFAERERLKHKYSIVRVHLGERLGILLESQHS